jgi:hypothetical protein
MGFKVELSLMSLFDHYRRKRALRGVRRELESLGIDTSDLSDQDIENATQKMTSACARIGLGVEEACCSFVRLQRAAAGASISSAALPNALKPFTSITSRPR